MNVVFRPAAQARPRLVATLVPQGAFPAQADAVVRDGAAAARFTGKTGQVFEAFAQGADGLQRLAFAGIGDVGAADRRSALERAGAALTAKYLTSGETALGIDFTGSGLSADEAVAVLFGALLRGWRLDVYRTKLTDEQKPSLAEIVAIGAPDGTEAAWQAEAALAEGVAFTRELVTEPANVIYPESFVARAQERLAGLGVEIRVLDKAEMTALGMGALLGVAQGSVREPRILAMRWKGKAGTKPTAFVGKGVTFDTGGISIKPAAGMEDMKWDMGGAAAVTGVMHALAGRKAKVNAIGVLGLVENMPDGNAQRPGDVVTSMSGQTIEVINTDAEGRLVLADALWYCQDRFKPQFMIDLATLTGAIIISLGHDYAGLFSNNDGLSEKLLAAGKAERESLWRLPLPAAYEKQIESPIADMKNVGGRPAGSITAGLFLQRFVNNTPWAHLDIASVAWKKPSTDPTVPDGAAGYGVRLLNRLVADAYEG